MKVTIFLVSFGMILSSATSFWFRKNTKYLDGTGIYKMKFFPLMPVMIVPRLKTGSLGSELFSTTKLSPHAFKDKGNCGKRKRTAFFAYAFEKRTEVCPQRILLITKATLFLNCTSSSESVMLLIAVSKYASMLSLGVYQYKLG